MLQWIEKKTKGRVKNRGKKRRKEGKKVDARQKVSCGKKFYSIDINVQCIVRHSAAVVPPVEAKPDLVHRNGFVRHGTHNRN